MNPTEFLDTPTPPAVIETLIDRIDALQHDLAVAHSNYQWLAKQTENLEHMMRSVLRKLPGLTYREIMQEMDRDEIRRDIGQADEHWDNPSWRRTISDSMRAQIKNMTDS